MIYERKVVTSSVEKQIITAMIVSTKFLAKVSLIIDLDFFVNEYAQIIGKWTLEYYAVYKKAPQENIQQIYEAHKSNIDKAAADLISTYLVNISDSYLDADGMNDDYVYDNALAYFDRRDMELRMQKAQGLLLVGKDDEAKAVLTAKTMLNKAVGGWETVFDKEAIIQTYNEEDRTVFSMPGALGEMIGPIQQGWFIAVLGGFKIGKCGRGNLLVSLPDGSQKRLDECVEQKVRSVLSFNESLGKFEAVEVCEHLKQGVKICFKVTTRTGREIEVTDNHPFLTLTGWKKLSELKVGDHIAVPRIIPFGKGTIKDCFAKILGYVIADGGLTCQGGFSFTKEDAVVREDFEKALNECGSTVKWDGTTGYIKMGTVTDWFEKIKLSRSLSKEKVIPDSLMKANKHTIATFLNALFTCDGTVLKTGKVQYCTSSEIMAHQIHYLLTKFGITTILSKKMAKCNGKVFPAYELTLSGRENHELFLKNIGFLSKKDLLLRTYMKKSMTTKRSFIDVFPSEICEVLYEETKNAKWKIRKVVGGTIRQCRKNKGSINRNHIRQYAEDSKSEKLLKLVNSEVLWDRIEKIECTGKYETYDLSLKNNYNFVANNFVIHNSFSLQEFAVSALTHRKRVAFFSLEMGIDDCRKRFYSRITGKGGEGDFLFPVFDCLKNQTGSCPKSYHRTNTVTLRASVKDKLEYNPVYAPCTYCRTNFPKDYIPETYFQPLTVKKPSLKRMIKDISSFESMYGDKILFRAFPRFSASVDDLRAALDALELQDSFIPDVVVVDYADILRPSKGVSNKEPRYGIDDIWKNLSALAAERRCIVITASQGNRGSLKKVQKEEADVAEWIGKIGHVDMFIALNQTPMEKKKGVLRYSLLAHRHKDFNPMDNVIVLQHLKTGQACLDSEVARKYHISTEDTED